MRNSIFPDCSGDKIWSLRAPQDSQKVGGIQLVEVDHRGAVLNIVEEIRDGGGHVEVSRYALSDTDGYEVELDAENHSLVRIHG